MGNLRHCWLDDFTFGFRIRKYSGFSAFVENTGKALLERMVRRTIWSTGTFRIKFCWPLPEIWTWVINCSFNEKMIRHSSMSIQKNEFWGGWVWKATSKRKPVIWAKECKRRLEDMEREMTQTEGVTDSSFIMLQPSSKSANNFPKPIE